MPASAVRELAPPLDDAGLRTALRNVPLLPAPSDVDDLLARLDADEIPFASGPLADLISDARYVEPAPAAGHADDDFFASVSSAANTNRRPPLVRRLLSGLFGAALLTGVLLILWNALLAPDLAPPAIPAQIAEPAGDNLASAPAPVVAANETAPAIAEDSLPSAEAPAASAEPLEANQSVASLDAMLFPEPDLEPVPPTPALVLEAEARRASASDADPAPAAQPEPAPAAPVPTLAAELIQPHETVVPPEPVEPVGPEPIREAVAEPSAAYTPLESAAPISAAPEPARDTEAAAGEILASAQAAKPAVDTPQPVDAAETQPVATALPEPSAPTESEPELVVVAATPVAHAATTARSPSMPSHSARAETIAAVSSPPIRPKARERVPFAGTWAASPEACTPAMQDEGHLLARVGARGGRAGDTSCGFKTIRRRGNTWHINAVCSDGETSWRSDVRLSLTRGRLTWTSQKGSTTYMRCPRA